MSYFLIWTIVIAVLTAVACSICGVFLVVKRESFVSEGLSHAVLPGIVVAYIAVDSQYSPWLIAAAAISGVSMILFSKWIASSGLIDKDASLGIVFSGMFSIGVIASSMNLKNVHFHADCIIDGNLSFVALEDFIWREIYFGPESFVYLLSINAALFGFITIFYKEMKLMAFDPTAAQLFGFKPGLLHLVWLSLVAVTAVLVFEIAGTVLVVALMIAPATAANLLVSKLSHMLWVSLLIGAFSAVAGTLLGNTLEIAPAGPIAMTAGFSFMAAVAYDQIR